LRVSDDLRLRVQQQPRLGEGFITIAEDSRHPSFHAKEGGKHRKLVSLGRHYHSTSRLPEYHPCGQEIEETEILMLRLVRILLLDIPPI
jgi:hypothetical protein